MKSVFFFTEQRKCSYASSGYRKYIQQLQLKNMMNHKIAVTLTPTFTRYCNNDLKEHSVWTSGGERESK